MPENIQLTTPEPTIVPGASKYEVASFTMDRGLVMNSATNLFSVDPDLASITVILVGNNGYRRIEVLVSGAEAATLIGQLNNANLSTISLRKRILNLVIQKGLLAGTVLDS